tara:strand:+ start:1561 stop:2556 length:996 start_codon:yes stop_codon:yes gene_type:complete
MDFVTINPTPKVNPSHVGGQFKKTVFFLNHSGLDIKVNYPNGEHVTVPTRVDQVARRIFEIHVEYEIDRGCSIHTLKEALGEKEYDLVEQQLPSNRKLVRFKYEVTDIDVIESGKGLYLEMLSMALTAGSTVGNCYPTGVEGAKDSNCFELKVVVVDHSGIIDGHYVKFLDYVFEAAHSVGTGLGDGIYLMSKFRGEAKIIKHELLPETGPVRVFRSLRAAKQFEGAEAVAERLQYEKESLALRRVELERELSESKAKFDEDKNRQELEHRQQINKLEQEKKRMETEFKNDELSRKDYYESRSQVRKDSSEMSKWLPAMITAMGAVISLAF